MKRKLPTVVVIAVLVLLAAVFLYPSKWHGWRTCPRFHIEPGLQANGQSTWTWTWQCMQADRVSNYFKLPTTMQALSARTGIKTSKFCYTESPVLRGAALVEVHFYADSSNDVWRIGQAASEEVLLFYKTNQPDVVIELIDPALAGRRRPMWREALDWVRDLTPW